MTTHAHPEVFPDHLHPETLPVPETSDEAFELLLWLALGTPPKATGTGDPAPRSGESEASRGESL